MQLRMLTRRSLSGSMTVVGDIAQATGALAPTAGTRCSRTCPIASPLACIELTIGYRIPAPVMALAGPVLAVAAPDLQPPRSVRDGEVAPLIRRTAPGELGSEVASMVESLLADLGDGTVAVVTPGSQLDAVAGRARGSRHRPSAGRRARRSTHRSRSCRSAS